MAFADTLALIQTSLMDVFRGKGRSQTETAPQPKTLERLLMEQTANVTQLMDGDICRAFQVAYLYADSTTLPTVSNTTLTDTCVIAAGDTFSSALQSYSPNVNIKQLVSVSDKDCDTVIKFAERSAEALQNKMHLIVRALNRYFIGRLNANKMTPTFAGQEGTINGSTIEFALADYDPDLLADWFNIATRHAIPEQHLLLSGQPFLNAFYNSQFHGANDNQRSEPLAFGAGNRLSFDTWDMDDVLGVPSTFCVDKNMVAAYFRNSYSETPREVGDTNNTIEFAMPLMYQGRDAAGNLIPKTLMFRNGGQMMPVMVDVRYQKVCDVTNTHNGRATLEHRWSLRVEGMFDLAPIANSAGSGILHFVQV